MEIGELLGQGGTLLFEATDFDTTWQVDLTGTTPVARQYEDSGAVTVRGPAVDLVLALYRRRGLEGLDVTGDAVLLKKFLSATRF